MLENISGYHLILASNSPRRNELMTGLGLTYSVKTLRDVDESYPDTLKKTDVAIYIASKKADAYRKNMKSNDLVITADTIVCVDNQIFGKPVDKADAIRMLQALSGKSHWVYTGVCLTSLEHQRSFTSMTEVFFAPLTDEEICWYVEHCKPFDKAGAYGVQEWIGFVGVERISGSYFNVMGLPVHQLYTELKEFTPLF
ncbi:MAG: Maf-like protein [Bacteroidales bacterium]|nr:Maf-like protein [Bacteroidales bacterium]MDD4922266.1 Maf-like protein [Bacteroidales bacterium]